MTIEDMKRELDQAEANFISSLKEVERFIHFARVNPGQSPAKRIGEFTSAAASVNSTLNWWLSRDLRLQGAQDVEFSEDD